MSHPTPTERARGISEAILAKSAVYYDPMLVLAVLEGRRSHPPLVAMVTAVLAEKPKEAQGGAK